MRLSRRSGTAEPEHRQAIYASVWRSPIGVLRVSTTATALIAVDLLVDEPSGGIHCDIGRRVIDDLSAYFSDPTHRFSVPLELSGSAFQRRVWDALRSLPAGTVLTYGELAGRLGSSARAVAGSCRSNPCPVVVPCHRIVGASGIGGFMGATTGVPVDLKRRLLALEGVTLA